MKADDKEKFKEAMDKEFTDHCERQNWDIVPVTDVPKDEKVLDCVWAMRRKRNILTKQVYKWKARLNLHGGQQEFGVNYYDTYSPVVSWFTMRLILIHALIHQWHTRQIDFVMAYPQAKIENTIYMKFPYGIRTKKGTRRSHVLKLKQNLYGQKQAGRVWFKHLTSKLLDIGFLQVPSMNASSTDATSSSSSTLTTASSYRPIQRKSTKEIQELTDTKG